MIERYKELVNTLAKDLPAIPAHDVPYQAAALLLAEQVEALRADLTKATITVTYENGDYPIAVRVVERV